MAYRVLIGGIVIECDSPEEAIEIAKRAGGSITGSAEKGLNSGSSRWTESRVKELFKIIKGQQRKVIDALLQYHEGRTDEQFLQMLGFDDGRKLSGVLAGLWKNAKKIGADPKDFIIKERITIGDKLCREYRLSDSFRRMASAIRK